MDIKKLTQEVLLKNMTPEQQMAVLDSVQASVREAKAVQKQKIAENVDLVLQALKRIEADMIKRVDGSAQVVEARVKTIKDGKDGKNGIDGKAGRDGKDGKNGIDGRNGKDGINGVSGERGQDGVGVQNAHIDFDGSLIIALTNGQELNVGEVVPFDVAEKIRVIGNGGGTSQYVVDTLADLQTQINNISGGLTYKGTWNSSSNTPTLVSSTGTKGWYYVVSTAGSTNLNGVTDWQVGDWAIYNGSTWQKIDQTNLVTSVNGNTGAVVLTASSVGALDTITSTDGSVTVSGTGTTRDLSVAVSASTTNVIVQVRNTTGATLTKGTVVYMSGATGQIPTVSKALATSDATSAQTLGMMTADLANNSNGYVTAIGLITNIDTSAYTDGAQLYLSGTTAGTVTTTKTYAPTHLVYVGVVEHAHPTQGKIFVKVQNGYELDEIHNVSAQSPTNGQTLIYNTSTSLWESASFPTFNQNTTGNATTATTATNVSGGTASVTTLTTSSTVTLNGGTANGVAYLNGSKVLTTGSALTFDGDTFSSSGTATLAGSFNSTSANGTAIRLQNSSVNKLLIGSAKYITGGSASEYGIGASGDNPIVFATNDVERMRLTSTGLGIGTSSIDQKLVVQGAANAAGMKITDGTYSSFLATISNANNYGNGSLAGQLYLRGQSGIGFSSNSGSTTAMILDSSGNLGLGVTPSAWSGVTAFQNKSASIAVTTNGNNMDLATNRYYNGTSDLFYQTGNYALMYEQATGSGAHRWFTSTATGTAGNAITFTQAMTLDASGNLGVGTTSPSTYGGKLAVRQTTDQVFFVSGNNLLSDGVSFNSVNDVNGANKGLELRGSILGFTTQGVERARIDSSGNLLVGSTSNPNTTKGYIYQSNSSFGAFTTEVPSTAAGQTQIFFRNPNGAVGSVTTSGSVTAYNVASDYRLKENIVPLTGALDKIAQLKPSLYNYKADPTENIEGFIAHELQAVVPHAVTGEKDAVDANGKPVYQGVDASFLIPHLVAAIQELNAKFEAYKATHP
jgi:hypothetical protein